MWGVAETVTMPLVGLAYSGELGWIQRIIHVSAVAWGGGGGSRWSGGRAMRLRPFDMCVCVGVGVEQSRHLMDKDDYDCQLFVKKYLKHREVARKPESVA
jgi:hypothetical protein